MPSPIISSDLRKAWSALSMSDIRKILLQKGAQKVEIKNEKNRHLKIKGKSRSVDLYATTGTVSANRKGKLKYCSHKEMMPERAFECILTLAHIGY